MFLLLTMCLSILLAKPILSMTSIKSPDLHCQISSRLDSINNFIKIYETKLNNKRISIILALNNYIRKLQNKENLHTLKPLDENIFQAHRSFLFQVKKKIRKCENTLKIINSENFSKEIQETIERLDSLERQRKDIYPEIAKKILLPVSLTHSFG